MFPLTKPALRASTMDQCCSKVNGHGIFMYISNEVSFFEEVAPISFIILLWEHSQRNFHIK
jgi:hypothetical protein